MGLVFNNNNKNSLGISEFLKYKVATTAGSGYSCNPVRKKLTRKSLRLLRSLGHRPKPIQK